MKEQIAQTKASVIGMFGILFTKLEAVGLDPTISLTEGNTQFVYQEVDDQFSEIYDTVTAEGFKTSYMGEVDQNNIIKFEDIGLEILAELYDVAEEECNHMLTGGDKMYEDKIPVCSECYSENIRRAMIEDNVGHGLHEGWVCDDCKSEDFEPDYEDE